MIVGNSSVGKSSLLLRFADDIFNDNYLATIGVDFVSLSIPPLSYVYSPPPPVSSASKQSSWTPSQSKSKSYFRPNIQWDTAGQERFRTITNAYYKGADGIIMVYDATSPQSFSDVKGFWQNEVQQNSEKNIAVLLLANKKDLPGAEVCPL